MRLLILFCILLSYSYAHLRSSEDYQDSLLSISGVVSEIYKKEYRNYIDSGIKSNALNDMNSLLPFNKALRRVEIEDISAQNQAVVCILCKSAVSVLLEYRREGKDEEFMKEIALDLCIGLHVQEPDVCEGIIERNLPILIYIVDNRPNLTDASVCGLALQGSNCPFDDPSFDWELNIDPNIPTINDHKDNIPIGVAEKMTVVQLSDVHYDPLYVYGGNADCGKPVCCHHDEKVGLNTEISAGKWGDYRSCDVPWYLYENTLNQIKNKHEKIDYLYFTGDVIDHGVWNTTHEGNKEALSRVNSYLKEVMQDIPVYPLIGNHETNPLNVFAPDYVTREDISTKWLYDLLADEWSQWLPESALETVRKGGYYTVVPRKGFRIIALNNNDCYTYNFWLLLDPEYPAHQLNWLHDTLLKAEKAGEYVHILAHVPSGEGSCYNTWSREYRRIIERFYKTISGIFNGHTHFDEFNIYYSKTTPKPYAINVAWNGGSLTQFSHVNANYRIYSVETETFQVTDHNTWIYNLTLANQSPDKNPVWYKEYDFLSEFHLGNASPKSLHGFAEELAKDKHLLYKYWELKVKSGDASLKLGCDDKCLFTHLCEIVRTQSNDVSQCEDLQKVFQNAA